MKRLSEFLLVAVVATSIFPFFGSASVRAADGIALNSTNFPDKNFLNYVSVFDKDGNKTLSATEIKEAYFIECPNKQIKDITGIKYFTSATSLDIANNQIEKVDLSANTSLTVFDCRNNNISSLDVSKQSKLTQLFIQNNNMSSLNIGKNASRLDTLYCFGNKFSEMDISFYSYLVDAYNGKKTSYMGNKDHPLYKDTNGKGALCCDKDVKFKTICTKTSISEGKGTITESFGSYSGDSISISANPASGYEFDHWTIIEGNTPTKYTTSTITMVADKNRTCNAFFTEKQSTPEPDKPTKEPNAYDLVPADSVSRDYNSVQNFVKRLYKYTFGREADQDGLDYWTNILNTYQSNGGDVAKTFINSTEFKSMNYTNDQFVDVLYTVFFDRAADDAGRSYWLDKLNSGSISRTDAANSFVNSQEWANTCALAGILSGTPIISNINIMPGNSVMFFGESLYERALGRKYDSAGLAYWASLLASHKVTGEQAGAEFFLCQEMKDSGISNDEFVTRLYITFMNRDPESDGFDYWVSLLNKGASRESVVYGFTRSPEFVSKCAEAKIIPFR
ncbi:MAG: DUF4214 domain-containing protein [Clostridiales bacterium]|nr:DUF4214 domain-containing protein [Clostridiales bacterium]